MYETALAESARAARLSAEGARITGEAAEVSNKMMSDSMDDALWRRAQENALSKLKGYFKLAETAGQMAN